MARARMTRVTKKSLKIIDGHRIKRYNKNLSTRDILKEVFSNCVEAVDAGLSETTRRVLKELKETEKVEEKIPIHGPKKKRKHN